MNTNNKGFGIVEGVLILAVVAILGLVGYKAYQNYTAKDADNSQQVTKRAEKKDVAKKNNVNTYTNQAAGFSFDYPAEWGEAEETKFEESQKGSYLAIGFSKNSGVSIGGNGTDYTNPGRGLSPLDDPGFIGSKGSYKTPGKFTESRPLDVIATVTTKGKGDCVLVMSEGEPGEDSTAVYRCNLSKGVYYGINFALNNPTDETKAELKTIVESLR